MSGLSCATISVLVIISLLNFTMLMYMMMESKKNCGENPFELPEKYEERSNNFLSSFIKARELKQPKFMAALVVLKYNRLIIMCGSTIISKFWVLTTAHCCQSVKNYPLNKIKISSNSLNWKNGMPHDVEEIIMHKNFNTSSATHNICLTKVLQPFQDIYEIPVPLASSKFHYIANSISTTFGWNSEIEEENDIKDTLYNLKVKLVPYSECKIKYKNFKLDKTMICAENIEAKGVCNFDSGGPLFQKNAVIGIVSFETDCASGIYPRVYTRISYFEDWIRQIGQLKSTKIGVKFLMN